MNQIVKIWLALSCVFISENNLYSQTQALLKGVIENVDSEGIHILNTTANKGTITNENGVFFISVSVEDTLTILSLRHHKKVIVINNEIIIDKTIRLRLDEKIFELDEVSVTPYKLSGILKKDIMGLEETITAKSLNLPNADVIPMSVNERRLLEADRGNFVSFIGGGISINLHKTLNRLSGRTKKLKLNVVKDQTNDEIDNLVNFLEEMNFEISETEVFAFALYCEADKNFERLNSYGNQLELALFLIEKLKVFKTER